MKSQDVVTKVLAAFLVLLASGFFVQASDVDPCALLTKAEVAAIFGELKGEPKPDTGLMKEKQCSYENMNGSWLKVGVYSSERWDMQKGMAMNPTDIPGLGDAAFAAKRGTDAEVYVRKGKWILEARSSSGAEVTKNIAAAALKKMP